MPIPQHNSKFGVEGGENTVQGAFWGAQMSPKNGFWPWKEAFGGDAECSMDINASTYGQRQLTESIVGGVGRGEEHLEQVWNLVLNPVIPGTVGVGHPARKAGPTVDPKDLLKDRQ